MIDVLLASAFFINRDAKQLEKMRPYPPLGTLYAASNLREHGFSVAMFDAMLASDVGEFRALLDRHRPRVVAVYEDQFNFLNKMCLAHTREAACEMSAIARARGATVIAAGSDACNQPQPYFSSGVDYVMHGEADVTVCELVASLTGRSARGPAQIPGLIIAPRARSSSPAPSLEREPERHPDRFPMPAWDLVDAERYRSVWRSRHGYFSLNMVTTRGCPFHCNWCAKPIYGQRYAMRSPSAVAEEMAHLKRTIAPDHIWFADDIFGLQPRWVAKFADAVETNDARLPFMIQTRVDLMTEKAVRGLARAGCAEVWLGVESGSQRILDAMDKGTKREDIPRARARLAQAGIKTGYFLQFGYPGEEIEDILATVALVRETRPDDIGVSVSYPLPGTKFYDRVRAELDTKQHWLESDDLDIMFQGPFESPFYRRLHDLLHRDIELAARRLGNGVEADVIEAQTRQLGEEWRAWRASAERYRNPDATRLTASYETPAAPDLSRGWN